MSQLLQALLDKSSKNKQSSRGDWTPNGLGCLEVKGWKQKIHPQEFDITKAYRNHLEGEWNGSIQKGEKGLRNQKF